MLRLPTELRRLCLEALELNIFFPTELDGDYFVDDDLDDAPAQCSNTLKAVRLVNKELGQLATEQLFRTVILNHNDESAEKLKNVRSSAHRTLVRRIVINTSDDPDYDEMQGEEAEIEGLFLEAIETLEEFENLTEVDLKFAHQCALAENDWMKEVRETADFRMKILAHFWRSLRQSKSLQTLAIKNLQDYHDIEIFASDDFLSVRNSLKGLHLQIATEYEDAAPESSIHKPAVRQFFSEDLPNIYLIPMSHQLTHLTLYGGECYWGVWPLVDLREVPTFSKLKSLSLGNYTIVHDWQIDWIVAHGDTLQELLLDDCMIATALKLEEDVAKENFPDCQSLSNDKTHYGYDTYFIRVDLRWHAIFRRFERELHHLNHFAIGSGNWDENKSFEDRYQLANRILVNRYGVCDCGIGPSQWNAFDETWNRDGHSFYVGDEEDLKEPVPDCDADDLAALIDLMQSIKLREGNRL